MHCKEYKQTILLYIEKEKIQVKIQGYKLAAIVFHGISMYIDSMW